MPSWFPHNLAETVVFVPLRVLFLILAAALTRYVLHRVINRTVRAAISSRPHSKYKAAQALVEATTLPSGRREQRIAALGSLGRSAVTFVVLLIAAVMILSELGFNVTSLVAGTSVVAVTIAFGMQNLVKDFISGVFMLIEDQLGVGDWVDLDVATGTVEEIGLRVTQLRDEDGTVWYVRNGEVLRVGNSSQGGRNGPPPAADAAQGASVDQ
jgi:small-conductance mechanosensitive channel